RPGEAEPEEHDQRGRGHGRVLARGGGLRQEGPRGLPLAPRMAAARALPWLLAGVVLTGCARTEPGLQAATAADALVDLRALDPSIRIEMPYATPHNFAGVALYSVARCLLRRDVAERLVRVERRLGAEGLGLLVWDCYRPFRVQQRLWALVPDARYVAEPVVRDGRPVAGSKHNRGAAVDLTLVDAAVRPLEMPSAFDDFSERPHRGWAGARASGSGGGQRVGMPASERSAARAAAGSPATTHRRAADRPRATRPTPRGRPARPGRSSTIPAGRRRGAAAARARSLPARGRSGRPPAGPPAGRGRRTGCTWRTHRRRR